MGLAPKWDSQESYQFSAELMACHDSVTVDIVSVNWENLHQQFAKRCQRLEARTAQSDTKAQISGISFVNQCMLITYRASA